MNHLAEPQRMAPPHRQCTQTRMYEICRTNCCTPNTVNANLTRQHLSHAKTLSQRTWQLKVIESVFEVSSTHCQVRMRFQLYSGKSFSCAQTHTIRSSKPAVSPIRLAMTILNLPSFLPTKKASTFSAGGSATYSIRSASASRLRN